MEVEKDDATWEELEEDELGKDPVSTAMNTLMRLSDDLGAKTTIACTDPIVQELLQASEWDKQQAGFVMIGVCSGACNSNQDYIKAKMQVFMQVRPENTRVQYAWLLALGMIFANWAPTVQKGTASLFFPQLIQKMKQVDQSKKMLTQLTSVVLAFVQGLVVDEDQKEDDEDLQALIKPYAKEVLQNNFNLLK